jgi:hypothetical protein
LAKQAEINKDILLAERCLTSAAKLYQLDQPDERSKLTMPVVVMFSNDPILTKVNKELTIDIQPNLIESNEINPNERDES